MLKVPFYALLIGINEYASPRIRELKGCVNDVEAIRALLVNQFGVQDEHIRTLINEQATHAAIKSAFREHLIGHAEAWAANGDTHPPPVFLFHYSGHGSQVADSTDTEPDGCHETIVPHDSRTEGGYDIKDLELRRLIDELEHYSTNITVILDCCHSGSGTRFSGTRPRVGGIRRCPMDYRPQPPSSDAQKQTYDDNTTMIKTLQDEHHVLIAACRDREGAYEYTFDGKVHGTMTYFLVQKLSNLSAHHRPTYQELHKRIRYEVMNLYPQQTPQCEGAITREIFGGQIPKQDQFFDVVEVHHDMIWINGGAVHHLTKGTVLEVYSPDTRILADGGPSLGKLVIEEVGVVQSRSVLVVPGQTIPLHARATVYVLNEDEHFPRSQIVLDIEDPILRERTQRLLMESEVAAYVDVIKGQQHVDFRLQAVGDKLEIQNGVGKALVAPYGTEQLNEVARDLERLVRYHNALTLHNPAANAYLAGKIEVTVKKLAFDANNKPVAHDLPTTPEGDVLLQTGQKVVFQLTNHSSKPLYMALLEFNNDWSIDLYYPPRGANEALKPGKSVYHGLSSDSRKQFKVDPLPSPLNEKVITLKAFATTQETNFQILTQGPLNSSCQPYRLRRRTPKSALEQLLWQAMRRRQTRFSSRQNTKDPSHEWTTTQIKVVIRPG